MKGGYRQFFMPVSPMRTKRKLTPKCGKVFILILLGYLFLLYLQGVYTILCLNHEIRQVKADIAILADRNSKLRDQVDALKDPKYVEGAARERLGLVKPGETLFILTKPANKVTSP